MEVHLPHWHIGESRAPPRIYVRAFRLFRVERNKFLYLGRHVEDRRL